LARTLFYDFPVTLLRKQEGPLDGSGPSVLMASHWPPESLPLREVELRAGYTIAWMQLLFEPGAY
jgi:hypothetical protein